MKTLLLSDIHYRLKQLDWAARVASRYDLVIIAGDHLDIASSVAIEAQVAVTLKYLERLAATTRLVVCSGNHDLNARNDAGEKVARWMSRVRLLGIPTDGDSIAFDDVRVTVCPWWDGPSSKESVQRLLAADAERRPGTWIWLYHAPPSGSPISWNGTRHFGDDALRGWIEHFAPDLVLCGHIHQSPFRGGGSWVDRIGTTWVFNAGCQIGEVPARVVIDTASRVATWYSLAGTETIGLDDGEVRRIVLAAEDIDRASAGS